MEWRPRIILTTPPCRMGTAHAFIEALGLQRSVPGSGTACSSPSHDPSPAAISLFFPLSVVCYPPPSPPPSPPPVILDYAPPLPDG